MPKRDIIVIGASAGGVYALKELVAALPPAFPAAILVVLHVSANEPSILPEILTQAGWLPAAHPQDGEPIQKGHIYIAPPDHHLLVEQDQLLVKRGPKENRFRPSIDALFRSAAYTYGPRVIGVILTGMLDDGTSGMWSIKRLGGVSVIQDPQEAPFPSMPQSVSHQVTVDHCVGIAEIAALLVTLVNEEVSHRPSLSEAEEIRISSEVKIAEAHPALQMNILNIGQPSFLTCPECHGALVRIEEGNQVRYRCHTGHSFSTKSLLSGVNQAVEESLWNAIRALEETLLLLEPISGDLEQTSQQAETNQSAISQVQAKLDLLRAIVMEPPMPYTK